MVSISCIFWTFRVGLTFLMHWKTKVIAPISFFKSFWDYLQKRLSYCKSKVVVVVLIVRNALKHVLLFDKNIIELTFSAVRDFFYNIFDLINLKNWHIGSKLRSDFHLARRSMLWKWHAFYEYIGDILFTNALRNIFKQLFSSNILKC